MKQFDRAFIRNTGDRFRFETLQSRYATFVDLWDRGLRAREEGRSGPFAQKQTEKTPEKKRDGDTLHVASFKDPVREIDKLTELYDSLTEARRSIGEESVPFHKFADLVKKQVKKLRDSGSGEVAFRVAVKDGKVNFTAKALKEKKRVGQRVRLCPERLDFGDVAGLRALGAVNDLELHRLALFERTEAVALNGRVVDEDVTASVAFDEPVTLGVVEPLDLACDAHRSLPTCCDAASRRLTEQ